ncbi:hypothetical protein BDN67DRAFT_1002595 [Paxillus ammoniavirescens]|nr:hypothetical protein BDN67DRAFT_1002595 [Paxillus ammoniavirescens]
MLLSQLFVLVVSLILFLCCRVFLQKKLYNDLQHLAPTAQDSLPQSATALNPSSTKSWHSALAQSSFSICFTECCVLFAMLMGQGFNLLDPYARLYSWRASLLLLLSTIIIIIPASFCMILTYRSETPSLLNIRAITFLLPVLLFVFALSFIPLPADFMSHNPLTSTTARLVVLGTTILGILSGFGAVNGAWGTFARKASIPSASSIASAETALERVKSDLCQRARDLEEYVAPKHQADGSWLSRVTFKRDLHQGSLQQEVIGLQALESQMTTRVAVLKRNRENVEFAESFRGRILSRTWAVYCVCRVCSSVINLLSPPSSTNESSSSYGDIIAHVFAYLLSLLPFHDPASGNLSIDVPSLSRQISLALVGVIILSSVRVVLKGVTKAFRITSRNISASLMLLLLAQLMGIYLLSTLVQLRTMFPPSQPSPSGTDGSSDDLNLFSTLPQYSLFGGLFDWSFLLGATGCALARWAGGLFGGGDEDTMY